MKFTMVLATLMAFGLAMMLGCGPKDGEKDDGETKDKSAATSEKVALDFHIMSKCPFGVKVLQAITPVLEKMGDNVDFSVYYIGREKDGELTSMHGEQEVQGNIVQLCAKEHGDQETWLGFLKCQNEDWRKIPEGWEKCAESAKLDTKKVKECLDGEQGQKLLRDSFKVSQEKRATGSPTIFLGGEPYRGGRSEASFGRAICAKFEEGKPKYCEDIPAPVKVPVTVVADKRCEGRGCDPKRFLAFITNTFEGAEIKELDYADGEGKELFEKSGEQFLPIAVFGPDVEKEETGYRRLKRRLRKIEGSDDFVYPLGRAWDPTAEVCDDGKDNTGNGQVDCADETCQGKKVCREEEAKQVSLFVMSQCPYGVRTVNAMKEVLDNFKKDRNKIDFRVEFIGNERDGKLTSMHGQGEVDENIRQLCAQKYYDRNYKFMDYVMCRNEAYQKTRGKEPEGNEWEACAKGGINVAVIKKCFEGEEGQALLKESIDKAAALGITGSPNWLLNNKYEMNGRTPEAIKNAYCAKNEGIAGCENTLSAETPGGKAPAGSCGGGGKGGPRPPIKIEKKPGGVIEKKVDAPKKAE